MVVTPQTSPPLAQVRELPAGDKVTGFYLLTKIETKPKRSGEPYLELRLQDASGHLEAKMWEGFEEIVKTGQAGDVVKVEGITDSYRDLPQLILSRIRLATEEEAADRRQFLPHSPVSATEAEKQLRELIHSVQNLRLRELLEAVFEGEFLRGFLDAPGGKMWHHATLGGLAEHTLSLAKLANLVGGHYPNLDRDLLVTGALLHDVGKVVELTSDVGFDYTTEGRLVGHIVLGTMLIEKKIAELPDFPEETRRQVLHLILSHQGDGSMGSPVKPMTLEALVLHYLDELDSKCDAFERVRSETPEGQDLSKWVNLMDRFFYFKPIEGHTDEGGEK
ncbi:HD domain-containing protein [bacterium]|nr:HD domain-containing protein [bacterium]MBU1983629.1 HD domain-containing protein [bacterium]